MEDEQESDDGQLMEDDYYALLNVPRDASQEEIVNAYRRLSKLFHPDKHIDPIRKREAEFIFNKVKQAYEVLKDPHQRAIYDSVGVKGLETEGWEIIQRTKTPSEIREEYERLARQREERRLQQRTNPRGNVTISVNAVELFNPYDDGYDEFDSEWPTVEVSGVVINQSVQAPLTTRDTATIAGYVDTHNGTGFGEVTLANKRQISEKGWVEVHGGVGSGPLLGFKFLRSLGKRMFFQGNTHVQHGNSGLRAGVDGTLAMQVGKSSMGYITWQTSGASSSMSTTVSRDTESTHVNVTFLLGIPHSYASLNLTWKLPKADLKLKSTVKAGTFGAEMSYGAEKKISEQSTVAATVIIGVPTGITLRLRLSRASQNYLIPIKLCDEVLPSPVFYATVAPLLTYAIVKKLIIDPIANEEKATKRQRQKETYRNRMAEKRKEARAAVDLMSNTFARIRTEEEARRGLVIVSAEYGKLDHACPASLGGAGDPNLRRQESDERGPPEPEFIDVTIPLQCLVKDSKLIVHDSTKSQLAGFYDPCVGEDKHLRVQYLFHSQLHETTIADNEALRIPRQSHRVNKT